MKTPTHFGFSILGSIVIVAGLGLGCTGCGSAQNTGTSQQTIAAPASVARIGHVVLLKLKDAADADELIAASDAALASIPGLTHYSAGTHLETGRDAVDSAYDVALYIGFDTEADYAAYLVHPDHVAYVEAWRPRFESIRILDVLDAQE